VTTIEAKTKGKNKIHTHPGSAKTAVALDFVAFFRLPTGWRAFDGCGCGVGGVMSDARVTSHDRMTALLETKDVD
jgi:hypothetical protein